MSERDDAIEIRLTKAREALAGAESEYAVRRYNNAANRCYYAAFQAAIAALLHAGIRSPSRDGAWGHDFVQAQFNGVLAQRRKLYSSDVAGTLQPLQKLRNTADYSEDIISEIQAARAVRRARTFTATIEEVTGGRR